MNTFSHPNQGTARAEQSEATIDREVLAVIRMMGPDDTPDFVTMLIDQFLQETSSEVGVLREAACRQDSNVLRAAAHRLKGSSLTMGAKRLAGLCRQLEENLERSADNTVAPLIAALDEEVIRVREAFAAERDHS
jgi:HPt (histidine-containing phosphotransfer) domain-containing protein